MPNASSDDFYFPTFCQLLWIEISKVGFLYPCKWVKWNQNVKLQFWVKPYFVATKPQHRAFYDPSYTQELKIHKRFCDFCDVISSEASCWYFSRGTTDITKRVQLPFEIRKKWSNVGALFLSVWLETPSFCFDWPAENVGQQERKKDKYKSQFICWGTLPCSIVFILPFANILYENL